MPTLHCPKCQERISITAYEMGEHMTCPACSHTFLAQEPRRLDLDDDDRRGRGERDDDRRRGRRGRFDDDDERRPRSKSGGWLKIILIVLGGGTFLLCGGCFGFLIYVSTAKQDFSGTWTDQTIADPDTDMPIVTASFPQFPVSNTLTDVANSGSGTVLAYSNMEQQGSMKDAVFLVGYIDYPPGTKNPLDKCYPSIRKELAAAHVDNPLATAKIRSEQTTTINGYPAREAQYNKDDGSFILRVIHLNNRPAKESVRLIVVLAGGVGLKDPDKLRFLNSLKIVSAK